MKDFKRSLYLLLFFFGISISVHGQWSWHAKAGADLTTLSGYKTKYELKTGVGYHFGLGASYDLGSGFSLQSTLLYTTRSFSTEGTSVGSWPSDTEERFYKTEFDASGLELPVNVLYTINMGNEACLKISTGPSFGYGIGGSYKTTVRDSEESKQVKGDYFGSASDVKSAKAVTDSRFDLGWNAEIVLDYKHFIFGIEGIWGILGHEMFGDKHNKARNVRYALSLGYSF